MNVKELIKKNLSECKIMQLATVSGGQPWICTVYYVADEEMNLYWLSLPSRRHSREIDSHNKAAITIPVKFDQPVIGMQAEGAAETVIDNTTVEKIMGYYVAKYNAGKDFYNNFVAGTNEHQMYRFTPKKFVLFDEVNFPVDSRKEWKC